MNALLIIDKDAKTALAIDLEKHLVEALEEKGCKADVYELGRNDVLPCTGCLLCFTKHPGECFSKDTVNTIRKNMAKYTVTFFLTPVIFGHYSATIASPVNKGTGSKIWQVFIGFGEDIDDEEKSTFIDLTAKHRGKKDVVHPGMDDRVDVYVTRSSADNKRIIDKIKETAATK